MLDIAVDLFHAELTLLVVFGSILAGVTLRSFAGVVSRGLARRGAASASEGG